MAAKQRAEALKTLTENLQTTQLVRLTVDKGKAETTFFVQARLLTNISQELEESIKAVSTPPEKGHIDLRFSSDAADAWETALYYAYQGCLPTMDDDDLKSDNFALLLTRCWLLGEKHRIATFQDHVMLELLDICRTEFMPLAALRLGFSQTEPKSKLYELMAEETARHLDSGVDEEYVIAQLEECKGPKDFMGEILRQYFRVSEIDADARLEDQDEWARFMVEGKPWKHWVFRKDEDEAEE